MLSPKISQFKLTTEKVSIMEQQKLCMNIPVFAYTFKSNHLPYKLKNLYLNDAQMWLRRVLLWKTCNHLNGFHSICDINTVLITEAIKQAWVLPALIYNKQHF